MASNKTAIIIGAGIGGIATAVFLSKNGYSVSVYEKNSAPGGRCGQLVREGYRFDLGATMLMMPGIYKEVFSSLGIPLFENGGIKPLDDLYRIFFDDNEVLEFSPDREKMRRQLEKMEPGSFARADKYVKKGYEIFNLGMSRLIARNFYSFFDIAKPQNIGLLIKLKTYISNWKYAKKFFSNRHLLMAYTFQNIYVGQSPFTSPALFSMVPAAELTEGSFFPKGGMFSIVQKLHSAAEENGVTFHYGKAVSRIKVEGDKAESIVLEDGSEIEADIIVSNADLPYVYRKLLPESRKSKNLDRLNYSCSAICFHWGLNTVYPQLAHHNVFLSDHFEEGLDNIFRDGNVSSTPSFYVHAPCRSDMSAAPAGHDTLSFIVAAGHIDKMKKQDWEEMKNRVRSWLIKRLQQAGLEDIEEHIVCEVCYTPESWETACNITKGSVFGSVAHNLLQMGWFRPHNQHGRYKNLYFVGGSTHPGNGIPNVLLSAKLTSERILRN